MDFDPSSTDIPENCKTHNVRTSIQPTYIHKGKVIIQLYTTYKSVRHLVRVHDGVSFSTDDLQSWR